MRKPYLAILPLFRSRITFSVLFRIYFFCGRRYFPNFILFCCQICFINMRIYSPIYFCDLLNPFLQICIFSHPILLLFSFSPLSYFSGELLPATEFLFSSTHETKWYFSFSFWKYEKEVEGFPNISFL